MEKLSGQKAVITGASEGIGAAIAQALARRGVSVGLLARRKDKLEAVAGVLRDLGSEALVLTADVTSKEQVGAAASTFMERWGAPDIVLANAGYGVFVSAQKQDTDTVLRMMDVNYKGCVHVVEAFLPAILERGRGHIAVVSSLAAHRSPPGFGAYSASKAAVDRYIEGLRIELKPRGIDFTTIAPGFVRTAMTARNKFYMPFLMNPDQVARHVVRALQEKRSRAAFPWPMAALTRLSSLFPDGLYDRVVRMMFTGGKK